MVNMLIWRQMDWARQGKAVNNARKGMSTRGEVVNTRGKAVNKQGEACEHARKGQSSGML